MARLRGSKWQADKKIDGRRVRVSFDTKEEAEAFELDKKSFRSIQEIFSECYVLNWRGTKDDRNCYRIVNELSSFFGRELNINTITSPSVTKFILSEKQKGNLETTIDRKLMRLRVILRHAVKQGDLLSPVEVQCFNSDNPRERFLTDQEVSDLFNELRHQRHYDFSVFLLSTGCRVSEALTLQWRSVSESSVSFYQTKNGRPRTIPLTGDAKAVLSQRRALETPFSDIDYNSYLKDWDRARKRTYLKGDPNVVPHILRHTLASRLAQSGVDLYRIKEWLGHSNIKTTERYAHLIPSSLDRAREVLDRTAALSMIVSHRAAPVTPLPELSTAKLLVNIVGECPERQRGRTVNPSSTLCETPLLHQD